FEPVVQQARILASGHRSAAATGKKPKPGFRFGRCQIDIYRVSGLLCDFESDGLPSLPLLDGGSLGGVAVRSHVLNAEPDQVAGPELAVYCEVEECQITETAVQLQARATRPDVLRLQRWFRANKLSLVPG